MDKSFLKKTAAFVLLYAALSAFLFWIVGDSWQKAEITTDPINKDAVLPELSEGEEVRQEFQVAADQLQNITLYANVSPSFEEGDGITVRLEEDGKEFYSASFQFPDVKPDGRLVIPLTDAETPSKGSNVTVLLMSKGKVSFWYGYTRNAGKIAVGVETKGFVHGGETTEGELVMTQTGLVELPYMQYYWPVAIVLLLVLLCCIIYCHRCRLLGKENPINKGTDLIHQYSYLLKTLVIRDFKIKYKASVLGILWSFLNPLLMTFVYMFVFSTLFRSSIENFVVYLMSGIILFNYFSESTNLGMQSIVGNAGLITKVYMPKYVFPVSKALSSGINLVISLIPLLIMMALTGTPFSKSLLLLPVVLLLLILFAVGVSLILSAAMVFFRDVQFLWGIFLTVLNFLSPVFYPESIIPARFLTLYHMNPLYQYLFFMRTIILGGISPTPITYAYCMTASFLALAVGLAVFRKSQSRFVLHL